MSIPTNLTPETAIDIVTSTFSQTVPQADVTDAPTGTGYASTCDSAQRRAMWWKYTAQMRQNAMSLSVDSTDSGAPYNPRVSVWTGTLGALSQYTISGDGSNDFCGVLGGDWFFIPIVPGTTYYILVTDQSADETPGAGLIVQLRQTPHLDAPKGSLLISDDSDHFPAAILSQVDGSFILYPSYPAGECSDWIPSGESCVQNGNGNATGVAVLAADLSVIAEVDFAPDAIQGIRSDKNQTFYVMYGDVSGASVKTVRTLSKIGVLGPTTWTLPSDSANASVWAVNRAGSVLYYATRSNGAAIHAYDLANDVALPDLYAGLSGKQIIGFSDGFVTSGGTICFVFVTNASFGSGPILRKFAPDGTLLSSIALTSGGLARVNHYADDPDGISLWLWGYAAGSTDNPAIFQKVLISDGSVVTELPPVPVSGNSGGPNLSVFNISNSCPLILLAADVVPPTARTVEHIRRLRRFPLPFDRSFWIYVNRIEFIIQAGMGLPPTPGGQGVDPILEVRFSGDGGVTWGNLLQIHEGEQGQYALRAVINRIGKMRNGICEISTSDPTYQYWLDCLIDADENVS